MREKLILNLFYSLVAVISPWQDAPQTVYIDSWKQGELKIQERRLVIEVNQKHPEREETIYDATGNPRYVLQVGHRPAKSGSPLYEYWRVDLCEFRKPNRKPKYSSDCRLLGVEGRGGGGDNFPKEDNVGWLYPLEKPELLKHGVSAYPIMAKRIIKVEGFYCVIQVVSYKMSQQNLKAVDSLQMEVEFTNKYETQK